MVQEASTILSCSGLGIITEINISLARFAALFCSGFSDVNWTFWRLMD